MGLKYSNNSPKRRFRRLTRYPWFTAMNWVEGGRLVLSKAAISSVTPALREKPAGTAGIEDAAILI
jgi:hypothetical protein